MPGRQAHGRPLLSDPNKKRKNNKKSGGNGGAGGARSGGAPSGNRSSGGAPRTRQGGRVDVMALAEQQIGESRVKGVRVRDLEIERDQTKRRRGGGDDDDDEDEDDEEEAPKRRRTNNNKDDNGDDSDGSSNEIHSDSSGNEWREGVGSDDDDSEIDSDEAFGDSDDDEIFDAFAFRGSSSKQNKNKKANKAKSKSEKFDDPDDFGGFDDDSDEDVGDDGADLGDEAIDLAAALDIVSSDEEEEAASSSKKDKSRRKKKQRQTEDSDMSASDDASDLSGSGSDDDSGSGSDELSSTESSEYDSDDEEDEDEDDEAVLGKSDALQSIASAYAAGQNGDSDDDDSDADTAANSSANPYQFNATLGSKDRSLKKSIKAAVGTSSDKKLDVPLLPMQQDRQLRVAAAEKANETLDRWTETVKQNRRAEHLSFDVAGAIATSGLDTATLLPINHKSAQTDLEKTILSIMEESGLGPQAQAEERAQQKELERQKAEEEASMLSPDALKAIIGQKRRARELQSREQARAKRIKKIKSKAYRRVHRRERQRAEEALDASDAEHDEDDEDKDSEAERDAAHRRRALERMGARHRDSKWAKRAKNTNRAAWDDEFRAGLVDMARQDEELRRRVDGAGVGGGRVGKAGAEEESDSDSFDEESDEEAFKLRTKQKLAAAGGKGGDDEPKGLMGIAFMRKAEEARKKENDEAVAEIMRDLDRGDDSDENMIDFDADGNGDDDEDAADKAVGRRSYGPVAGQKGAATNDTPSGPTRQERRRQAAAEREAAAAAVATEKPSHAADVSNTFPARQTASAPGDAGSWTVVAKTNGSSKDKKAKKNGAVSDAVTPGLTSDGRLVMSAVVDDVLAQNKAAENKSSAKQTAAAKKAAQKAAAATAAGYDSETSSSGSDSDDVDDARGANNRSKHFRFRAENEQLLRKALGEDGAAAEFAAEKVRQAAEEAAAWEEEQARVSGKKNKNSEMVPGWGSWVGDGVSKRAIKRDQRAVAGPKGSGRGNNSKSSKEMAVRRDAKSDKVIVSERRVHKNEKYLASQLPHEFETRSQYERSLRLPVGPEWSTTFAFQDATKPRVLQKQGVVLPMAKPQL